MNHRAFKTHIEEKIHEYCVNHEGPWAANITRYFDAHPEEREQFIIASGEGSIAILAAKFQRDQLVAAAKEADEPSSVTQLRLPGIPHARLSPVVEVVANDWRSKDDVSMVEQVAHSDRTATKCHRWGHYQEKKGDEQRIAAAGMEQKLPGSSKLPMREAVHRLNELGSFDETETPLAAPTSIPR